MDLKEYRNKLIGSEDERAVSPVIGVILMVAITVILAAVIAAFVLDIGDLDDSAPNAQYDWESDDDNQAVTISHQSGDDIDLGDVSVSIEGDGTDEDGTDSGDFVSSEFTAGDEITFSVVDGENDGEIDIDDEDLEDGNLDDAVDDDDGVIEQITLTWESDGTSTIIAEHEL